MALPDHHPKPLILQKELRGFPLGDLAALTASHEIGLIVSSISRVLLFRRRVMVSRIICRISPLSSLPLNSSIRSIQAAMILLKHTVIPLNSLDSETWKASSASEIRLAEEGT